MKTTITTLLILTLVVAVFAQAKAGNPVNTTAQKTVSKKSIEMVSPSSISGTDEKKCDEQNAEQAISVGAGQAIKYGTVIQDGQIMIIQNKPLRLFA